jgi:hypothetical protein
MVHPNAAIQNAKLSFVACSVLALAPSASTQIVKKVSFVRIEIGAVPVQSIHYTLCIIELSPMAVNVWDATRWDAALWFPKLYFPITSPKKKKKIVNRKLKMPNSETHIVQ